MPGGDEIVKGARARGRDEASEQALAAAFDKGGAERVTRLYTGHFTSGSPGSRRAAALSDLCFRSKAVWGYDP